MDTVSLTCLGIGGATALGAVLGDRLGRLQGRWTIVLRGAGLLMLFVILFGFLQTLWQEGHGIAMPLMLLMLLMAAEILGDRAERMGLNGSTRQMRSLFTAAVIAVHHFPEGIAAGIGCMQGTATASAVCWAVVLHSIPETMLIVPTMRSGGFPRTWGYWGAAVSGAMEIAGVLIGAII